MTITNTETPAPPTTHPHLTTPSSFFPPQPSGFKLPNFGFLPQCLFFFFFSSTTTLSYPGGLPTSPSSSSASLLLLLRPSVVRFSVLPKGLLEFDAGGTVIVAVASRKGLLLASSLGPVRPCTEDAASPVSESRRTRSVFSFSSSAKRLELWASRSALCLAFVSLTLLKGEGG